MASMRKCVSCGTQLGALSQSELLTALKCSRCEGEMCIACLVVDKSQPICKKCYNAMSAPASPEESPEYES